MECSDVYIKCSSVWLYFNVVIRLPSADMIDHHVCSYISKMHFSYWEPLGVSEKIWSVNLDASISGEYQTLGGQSGWPSE